MPKVQPDVNVEPGSLMVHVNARRRCCDYSSIGTLEVKLSVNAPEHTVASTDLRE